MPVNEVHLNALLETIPQFQNQGAFGHVPRSFLNGIINAIGNENVNQNLIQILNTLPNRVLNRTEVFEICNSNDFSFAYKVVCVFAWGAMRQSPSGAYSFFRNWDNYEAELENIIQNFRLNSYSRSWTYERLKRMNFRGCRPAYYSKLIFFFGNGNSYIMDQWTSKSIELLWTGVDKTKRIGIIFDQKGNYVQANNHSGLYEEFCNRLEYLTLIINEKLNTTYTTTEIEEIIFSNGGNDNVVGQWRRYVRDNWQY